MNINKLKGILCISVLLILLSINCFGIVYAVSSSDLKDIDEQIEEKSNELAGVKGELSENLEQIDKLNAEISTVQNDIDDLQTKIDSLTSEITTKDANIKEQEEKYATQKDLLDKRLVALYESGSTSYLDMLLSSDGLADFISKYYTIEVLAESDQELLTKIDNTRKQIENEKASLEAAKAEIQTSQAAIVEKKNTLAASKNQKSAIASNLSEEEKILEQQLEEFEEDKRRIQKELAALAAKNDITPVAPSAAGYISPLSGKTKANITTGYGSYSWGGNHTGVDFACASGTPIYAVKSGTVVTSTALRNSSGNYKSYGEYIVIDHHDGTMTLYAHMYPGSRLVSKDQNVSQGQQIGSVGTTGNSSGNHLHFEVRINGRCVNPTAYLP
jgi:hypothetical protein